MDFSKIILHTIQKLSLFLTAHSPLNYYFKKFFFFFLVKKGTSKELLIFYCGRRLTQNPGYAIEPKAYNLLCLLFLLRKVMDEFIQRMLFYCITF